MSVGVAQWVSHDKNTDRTCSQEPASRIQAGKCRKFVVHIDSKMLGWAGLELNGRAFPRIAESRMRRCCGLPTDVHVCVYECWCGGLRNCAPCYWQVLSLAWGSPI